MCCVEFVVEAAQAKATYDRLDVRSQSLVRGFENPCLPPPPPFPEVDPAPDELSEDDAGCGLACEGPKVGCGEQGNCESGTYAGPGSAMCAPLTEQEIRDLIQAAGGPATGGFVFCTAWSRMACSYTRACQTQPGVGCVPIGASTIVVCGYENCEETVGWLLPPQGPEGEGTM